MSSLKTTSMSKCVKKETFQWAQNHSYNSSYRASIKSKAGWIWQLHLTKHTHNEHLYYIVLGEHRDKKIWYGMKK